MNKMYRKLKVVALFSTFLFSSGFLIAMEMPNSVKRIIDDTQTDYEARTYARIGDQGCLDPVFALDINAVTSMPMRQGFTNNIINSKISELYKWHFDRNNTKDILTTHTLKQWQIDRVGLYKKALDWNQNKPNAEDVVALFKKYANKKSLKDAELAYLKRWFTFDVFEKLFWACSQTGLTAEEIRKKAEGALEIAPIGSWLFNPASVSDNNDAQIFQKTFRFNSGGMINAIRFVHVSGYGYFYFSPPPTDFDFKNWEKGYPSLLDCLEAILQLYKFDINNYFSGFPDQLNESQMKAKEKPILLNAVARNNIEEVISLISQYQNQNQKTKLLEAKNMDGFTPLIKAASNNRLEIVKLLLNANADIEAQNVGGYTALGQATFNGHEEMIKLLVAHGADLFTKAKNSETIADIAKRSNGTNRDEIIKLIASETAKQTKKRKASAIDSPQEPAELTPYQRLCIEKGGTPYESSCGCGALDSWGRPTGKWINPYFEKCS